MTQESAFPVNSESSVDSSPQDDRLKFFDDTLEIIDSKIAHKGKRSGHTLLDDRARLQAEIDRLKDPEYPRSPEDMIQISQIAKAIIGRNNPDGLLQFHSGYVESLEKGQPYQEV